MMADEVPSMRWVSLHNHTTFSFGDGYGPVETHVRRAADLGMKAVACTEHGNTSSHVQLEKACRKVSAERENDGLAPILPIYGLEAYLAPAGERRKWHQTVLAKDETGLQNLNRMVTESWRDKFYHWPTVDTEMLERLGEGLVVTSGCADSLLSCTLLGGKSYGDKRLDYTDEQFQNAINVIEWYQSIFGNDYYLEVQRFPGLERTCVLNPAFEKLSEITGARLVGTADVHYPFPKDNEMQKILHASHRGSTVSATEASWEYNILLTYPESDQEIYRDLRRTGLSKKAAKQAILNTERIAKQCKIDLPKNEPIKFPYPGSVHNPDSDENGRTWESIEDYIWDKLREGWEFRRQTNQYLIDNEDEYIARIKYEMERITPRGFCDYFGMLADAVTFAKDNKIPVGPARGSAAASLVCYLLRITEVDPMQFKHMLFERFIDPKRLDLPDVDLDFADDRRDEVRQHLVRRYGDEKVGNIGNFTRYRGKNSIDDVSRVYNIPNWEAETVKDLIVERSGGDSRQSDSLNDTFEAFPKAHAVLERHPELEYATRLEGNYRGLGVHAAGIVISNTPITDTCAVYTRNSAGRSVSVVAYDKKDAEYLGMLKADFLGLSTMGMIGLAIDQIGMDLEDLYRIPIDEPDTLAAFKRNDVTGIFQFEGRATRLVCQDVAPDNFQQLADINALSRPGPLFSGMTAQYVEIKHGREEPESLHPIVDGFTEWTHGQMVYQEQVLGVIRDLGGFSVQRVGDIRKIISQKLGEASFEAMWEEFRDGAYNLHGVREELALRIWKFMVTSATYSFCVTGDTVLEKSGKGHYATEDGDEFITVAELYRQQNGGVDSRGIGGIPLSDKIRSGRLKILGMDDDGRIRPNNLIRIDDPMQYRCTKITTDTGRTITVSNDHIIMTSDGYRHTMELSVGDKVIVSLGKQGRQEEKRRNTGAGQQYKGWEGNRQYDITGPANPAWIDGRARWLREAQDEAWDESNGKCQHCSTPGGRSGHELEFAHAMPLEHFDGDMRKYHSSTNLMVLCNSCHKKYDYRIQGSRKKQWSVGRPTGTESIVSIEDAGVQDVYDIRMLGPSHNYQGNGFIHHNNYAHCVSYSLLAFWQMWLKVHHPTAFYAAQLTKVGDGKDQLVKRSKLMQDALRHGQTVLPPDPVRSGADWTSDTENNTVIAGFQQIDGVGPATAQNILEYREENGIDSWDDLINVRGVGPKSIQKIVEFCEKDDPFDLQLVSKILKHYRSLVGVEGTDYAMFPRPTHRSDAIPKQGEHTVVWMGIARKKNYQDYVENQRTRTGDDTKDIIARMKDPHLVKSCVVQCYDDGDEDVYVRFNRWIFPRFERALESLTPESDIIVVRGLKREDFGVSLHVKDMFIIDTSEDRIEGID